MSRVPYVINVDEFICTALEQIRTMDKVRDYSGLMAAVERIQHHANKMEEALYRYEGIKYKLKQDVGNKKIPDKDFRDGAKKILEELDK